MRLGLLFAVVIAFFVAAAALLTRVPVVEDALFQRAVDANVGRSPAAWFDDDGLHVFFCGTGSPLPSARRAQTCTAIFAGDRYYLVDSGTGSWETVQAAGIPGERLGAVFLTHFHSDHIGDLGEANLGSWVGGRATRLAVYGPQGVGELVDGLNRAFAQDNAYRTAHHGKSVAEPRIAGLEAVAFDGGASRVVFEKDGLVVTAFPVAHDPVSPAVGYRFDYKGRSVVVSGDTAFSGSLVEAAKGADLLIHEAQANHMVARIGAAVAAAGGARTAKIMADIPSYHTSPEEAARAANEAGAQWLVLTHLTPAPDNPIARRIFMRGVADIRPRNVALAEDGMTIRLPAAGGVQFSKTGGIR